MYLTVLSCLLCSVTLCFAFNSTKSSQSHRNLQLESMFDNPNFRQFRGRKGSKQRNQAFSSEDSSNRGSSRIITRQQALASYIEEITLSLERYHMWWTGPPQDDVFKPSSWGAQHSITSSINAVFTMAVIQGHNDKNACSKPIHDFQLYFGTLRRYYNEDIVVAVESSTLELDSRIKDLLIEYKAVVYEIPPTMCSKDTTSIFCGSSDERVPSSVFRYFFYEKWASIYNQNSLILLSDFRDVIFQANPFQYRLSDWYPDHHLAVFNEFYPNMVINRCRFNRKVMSECFGDDALEKLGRRVIVSSGGLLGSRDGILAWSRHMTTLLQDAPGRQVETRCASGGIEHGFINYLIYGNKLRTLFRIKVFAQGEGAVNSLGGLRPDTVEGNVTGNLRSFWKVLNDDGHILNWSGEVSPVVHQLDHYLDELLVLANEQLSNKSSSFNSNSNSLKNLLLPGDEGLVDLAWQALASSRCLWGCKAVATV